MTRTVHIAGLPVWVGSQQRQRCAWCAAVISDDPLDRTAVAIQPCGECAGAGSITIRLGAPRLGPRAFTNRCRHCRGTGDEPPTGPGTWAPGGLIAIEDHGWMRALSLVEIGDDDPLPDNCCAKLPPELTAWEGPQAGESFRSPDDHGMLP